MAFHVGAHKTGTSLVQAFLRQNSRRLRRRHLGHLTREQLNAAIGARARELHDPAGLSAAVASSLRNPWISTVLVSYEKTLGRPLHRGGAALYPQSGPALDTVARVLDPYRQHVLLSIRPQAEFVESYYLQLVHQGGQTPFDEWYAGVDVDALSWRPIVERLVATFGAEQVQLVDFRLLRESPQAFLREFFSRLDPRGRIPVDRVPKARNPSLSQRGLEIALAVNPHLTDFGERHDMRMFLQRRFSNQRYPRPQLLSDEQRQQLRERYDTEYDQLVAAHRA